MLHKTKRNNNITRASVANKHKRIIEEYATIELIYTSPSQFSEEFSNVMKCVEMMALENLNKGFGKVGAKEYKWANVVIDEGTGDVVHLKKLLKHLNYTEA